MKRISIAVGLVIAIVLGVVLLPRLRQPAVAESAPAQFQPHSLRGMTADQLKEYAQAYAAYAHIGQIDSIPFAKVATEKEMHDAGLVGSREDNYSFAWVIFKGNVVVTVPGARPETPKTVPYQILGFDLDNGKPFHTAVSPEGTGLGKLVGDPSLPPPPSMLPHSTVTTLPPRQIQFGRT